ncbi:TPA: hypothetical protein PXM37_002760 [Yersinia enterocolitica]|nr:hypothetical protein [Yersinia enterocolitica]HDL6982580.1 hypothetical protein [Yersinia enterocolitica]HDL7066399.1 hypothetical protein [Yersinia enterocolitica]HDL7070785.1 hypothetical protein [Yersinia enterocolitica]
MSNSNIDLTLYPVDAAYQVALEMAKAGAFNGVSDRGSAFVSAFNKIKDRFEEVKKEEANK